MFFEAAYSKTDPLSLFWYVPGLKDIEVLDNLGLGH